MKKRTGKECKKTNCEFYHIYSNRNPLTRCLSMCMECKNAYVSQYVKIIEEIES